MRFFRVYKLDLTITLQSLVKKNIVYDLKCAKNARVMQNITKTRKNILTIYTKKKKVLNCQSKQFKIFTVIRFSK